MSIMLIAIGAVKLKMTSGGETGVQFLILIDAPRSFCYLQRYRNTRRLQNPHR